MLNEVAVIGAGGKMGRGIALVLLQTMALNKLGSSSERVALHLVDSQKGALEALRPFLREHLKKFAEKKINLLREQAAQNPQMVSNGEIISAFIEGGMDSLWLHTDVYGAKVVFEAITEDLEAKAELFKSLDSDLILTNTSSIPIHILEEKSGGRCPIAGFHFYNPAHVQTLVELAFAENTRQTTRDKVYEMVKRLEKTAVEAKDVAGFIGNGHFIRELNFACRMVEELALPLDEAVYIVNKISGDYLLRPMGIFDLVDYIGFETCEKIAAVMSRYLEPLIPPNFKQVMQKKTAGEVAEWNEVLGPIPEGWIPWKQLSKDPKKGEKVSAYLQALTRGSAFGEVLAQKFLEESQKIGKKLVRDGVASSIDDLNTVLIEGFHHLYGVFK
jgi:3-hydroxybutyryl-CoA dehydrogenase